MRIRKLLPDETCQALELAWQVFLEFEAPDYGAEGVAEFRRSIDDTSFIAQLCFFGACEADRLIGLLATRNNGSHIALFFVDSAFQRQGIGRALFMFASRQNPCDRMTVNASPYAVPVYLRLGFLPASPEQITNGLRYTPMSLAIPRSDALCPCGADCTACDRYPAVCAGCAAIHGKVWWTAYTGQDVCPYYACCVEDKHLLHCGNCPNCPCPLFKQGDPTRTEEENAAIFRSQMERLQHASSAQPSRSQ